MESQKKQYCLEIADCWKHSTLVLSPDKPDMRLIKKHLEAEKPLSKGLILKIVRTFIQIVSRKPVM